MRAAVPGHLTSPGEHRGDHRDLDVAGPAWRAGALEWAAAELARRGLALDGEPEQPHVYAWSTALRLPVDGGAVWLKSVGPGPPTSRRSPPRWGSGCPTTCSRRSRCIRDDG